MTKTLKLFIISSVLLFTAFYSLGAKSVTTNVLANDPPGHCSSGWIEKIEEDDAPFISSNSSGSICSVWIKAGTPCYEFSSNTNNGCYVITGVGGSGVQVTRTGSGPDCKGISHVEFHRCPAPTSTPIPTNIPTPTVVPPTPTQVRPTPTSIFCSPTTTNTPSPTNTPTDTPTPTSTPTSTPTPTLEPTPVCDDEVCPTSTPTPTATPTQIISGTPQPTPSPIPTATPTGTSNVGGGDNGGSNPPGAPVCTDPKPGTPSNLRVTRISSTQARLDWDHASDPHTSYVVAYGPSLGNYPWGSPNVGNNNSYTVNSLTPGAQYCFYVRAQNNCMPGDKSNEVCINVGSTVKILGVTDNYNPIVDGIRESYGGDILGTTTELMTTAEVVYAQNKLPSGNTLVSGQSISIPKIGVNQPIYAPARIGDDYTVGHQEVLHTTIDGSSVYYGHNGYDVFGSLHRTNIGDQVVTNNNGVDSGYNVTEKLFVHKSQVDSIKTTGDQIVLVTCSFTQPDYRIVVKASLTK
ncbi:fibronectin type III domain-containing protein [Candidatus Shapirobacteria bacterium]|nr:fibronectin type III domain-containing protein [Candidatus Shapirobacteria bacterium]